MHKLFIKNDWQEHKIYRYNIYDLKNPIIDIFTYTTGSHPDNGILEVYFPNMPASIDYTFDISMSPYIFKMMECGVVTKAKFGFDEFEKALLTLASTYYNDIVIEDYPDKWIFHLPMIKKFREEFLSKKQIRDIDIPTEYIEDYDEWVDITFPINDDNDIIYNNLALEYLIVEYANILKTPFCKITASVDTSTFELLETSLSLSKMANINATTNISCRRIDEGEFDIIHENEERIDLIMIPALKIANQVSRKYGAHTIYSCCGHSYDCPNGYVSFKFKLLNSLDQCKFNFIETIEKANEEDPKFEEYFEVEADRLDTVIIRFKAEKYFELAVDYDPDEVVSKILDKFIQLMIYTDTHFEPIPVPV